MPFTLTFQRAHELLSYDPLTGLFHHKKARQGVIVGEVAGSVHKKQGYVKMKIDGEEMRGHQLAWFMHFGVWASHQVDHENGNRADNRIKNLRDVTQKVNAQNQRFPRANNKSGLLGVCSPSGHDRKFKAALTTDGKTKMLGRFDTAEAAQQVYLSAKRAAHAGCTI